MKMKKRFLALLLAAVMVLPAVPLTANAVGLESGQSPLKVNQSKVAFAGHEWWVIGDETSGVYPQPGHITLLAANLDEEFQNVPFRSGKNSEADGYTKYTDSGLEKYYANNPDGNTWVTPNEYVGSTLQQKMVSLANKIPDKEQAVISARDLANDATEENNWLYGKTEYIDGMAGQGVKDQKLWALSEDEWNTIGDAEVLKYYAWWWLRTPYLYHGYESKVSFISGVRMTYDYVDVENAAARPAFSLNLFSVLFTSSADENGKSSATVVGGLVDTEEPVGTVKFTMKDESQALNVEATTAQSTQTGETLSFSYSGATTGDNQYISCVLTDDSGVVKYYGKLADSSSAPSGNLSIPLADVADGTYTLSIFSEEANEDMYTDFCSEPVTMRVVVTSGKGTVSEFSGTLLHEHSWSDEWQENENYHWHECTAEDCPITDNSQKDGYAEHTYDQTVAADEYLKSPANCEFPAVYYKSCVCGAKGTKTFTVGTPSGHSWSEWTKNTGSDTHTRTCSSCKFVESENCLNGTATCKDQAICEICGSKYGELDASNHSDLVKTEAKAATHLEAGNKEYWYCDGCNKYFSDEAGTKEISLADTVIPKLTDPDKENTDVPQTGDSSHLLVWILLTILSGGAVLTLTLKGKRKTNQ